MPEIAAPPPAAPSPTATRSMVGPRVTLSTTSVYPESTESAFGHAARIGFDGVELMVGIDPVAADIDRVEEISRTTGVAVHSVHAPCLLVTPNVWGTEPWGKLEKAAEACCRLGAGLVVVHPPFRWQRDYASGFEAGIAELNRRHAPIVFAVENMYPWRTPAGQFAAYAPDHDPTTRSYDHLVLDLSHAATARADSRELVQEWGSRLRHIHLTDGAGSFRDEHLLPGQGNQHAWQVVERAVASGFSGDIVLEVNTRRMNGTNGPLRAEALAECLVQTRMAVDRGVFARQQVRPDADEGRTR